jgi:ACS family glucarate transporter-like MFS transporter
MGHLPDGQRAEEAPAIGVRYIVLLGLCAANLLAYVHRNSIGVAEETIRTELHLTEQEMGWVLGAFFATYAAGQIPAGWLGHRWGTRRTLPLLTLLGSAAISLVALATNLPALLAARLGLGAAQAGMLPCSTNSLARWFPRTRRGSATGMVGSSLSVGGVLGASLTGAFLELLGWRCLFLLYALPGLVWAIWFYLWFRDRPRDHPSMSAAELALLDEIPSAKAEQPAEPTPWRGIFTSPAMLWICGQQFFRAAGYTFYASWFATYLRKTRDVSLPAAGLFTSLPLCGVVCGSLIGGMASDLVLIRSGSRRLARQGVAIGSMVLCALFILLARPIADAWPAVLLITAGSFCSSFAGPCAYAITIDMGGKHIAPVFSTMNMSGNVGALLFPVVIPWLVGLWGNWDVVLPFFAAIHLASAVCWLCLNPNGTIFDCRADTAARS